MRYIEILFIKSYRRRFEVTFFSLLKVAEPGDRNSNEHHHNHVNIVVKDADLVLKREGHRVPKAFQVIRWVRSPPLS